MRSFPITLAILTLFLSPAAGLAGDRGAAPPSTSPCEDARYQALITRPVSQMTDREYEYFSRIKRECNAWRAEHETSSSPLIAGTSSTVLPPLGRPTAETREPRIGFTFDAGFAPPTGPMTDIHNIGRSFGGGLSYQIDDQLALDVISLGFEHFALDKKEVPTGSLPGGSLSVLSLLTGIRARLTAGNYSPFVALGVGIFRSSYWDLRLPGGEVIDGKSMTALGMSAGGGIEGRVSEHSSAFTEIRATFAPAGNETRVYVPVRGGLRFDLR